MKVKRGEFKKCARQLVNDKTIQKMETENYIFIRVEDSVTVKFKNIDGLTGYFTMAEIENPQILTAILKTAEKELNKRLNPKIPQKEGI